MIEDPAAGCRDLVFAATLHFGPEAQVALEDYARVRLRARHVEALLDAQAAGPPRTTVAVRGLHLCAPEEPLAGPAAADVEAFASDLANAQAGPRLGWN